MSFETVENVLNINTDAIMTLAMASILLLIGYAIKNKVNFLAKYCIPAPVIGGFIFMFITFAGHTTGTFTFNFTNTFQDPFMLAFFTTVGLGASFSLLKKGGILLIVYWLCAGVISIFQNIIGIAVGTAVGLEAPYALLSSAISMIGGHGAAGSYGSTFESLGYSAAMGVGAAAATFGLVAGSLMGGPTARRLINKYGLRPDSASLRASAPSAEVLATDVASEDETFSSSSPRFVKGFMVLLLAVGIGSQVSAWLTALTRLTFPGYIGAMLVAVVVRNVMDGMKVEYPAEEIDTMGNMFLSIFLAMALAGLKLWELVDLALPMLLCLVAQCVVMVLFSYLIVFRVMGRNYDAAVMTAGFIGFSMGATSNAMANMQVVTKKYGPSPVAYFAIPMVGGMFIDFFNAVLITFNIGLWAH